MGWTATANSKSLLGLCPASLAPECASRLRWLLWEDRTLHLHILSVSSVGKLERPLARSARNPTMNQKQSCASPTQPLLRIEASPLSRPAWRNRVVITGSIADAAVAFVWSRVFLHLFIMSPCHDPSQREHKPHRQGVVALGKKAQKGRGCLDVALGTCTLWSFSKLESAWPYSCLP